MTTKQSSTDFTRVIEHVKQTDQQLKGSGSALYIIQNGEVVIEEYWGKHSNDKNSKLVGASSQFHIADYTKVQSGSSSRL